MRILLVGDYPPDPRLGSTKVLVKLREEFRALGHTCDLLLADGIGARPRNSYLRQALGPVLALSKVRRLFRQRGRYDVVDVASAEGLWIGALRRTLLSNTRVISRSNGLEHLNYRRMLDDHAGGLLYKPWTRRLFHPAVRLSQVAGAARAADRLLLLNEGDRQFALSQGWKRDACIDVVPHGVSTKFIANPPPPDEPRGRGILFCSSWSGNKGVPYLTDAFRRLIEKGAAARLTVVGGGLPADRIRADFDPAVRQFVTIVERLSEEQLMLEYRAHDLMVLPSTYEGFGMVIIEAMSQRLPVVVTPVGCAPSLVVNERTGLIVPPRDPVALADALARMLTDPALRDRCAAAAFDRVRDMTWTRTAMLTLDVYNRALDGNGRVH